MSRPGAGAPPIPQSAVAPSRPAVTLQKYQDLVVAFDREDRKAELLAMLGSEENVQRFLAVAFHAIATNSNLLSNATIPSLIQAVKDSASLGLEPTGLTGEAWILCYGTTATLIPGWRGFVKRIRNSGAVSDIDCQIVYMNDDFAVEYGTEPKLHHIPKLIGERDGNGQLVEERGHFRGAYAIAWMPSGRPVIEWMTEIDILQDAKRFSSAVKSGKPSPWDSHPGEMYRKTAIKRLSKRLPQSAVDLLIKIDNTAEALAAGTPVGDGENGTPKLDVSKARAAALAALGNRPALAAGSGALDVPDAPEPEAEPEPVQAAVAVAEPPAPMEAMPLTDDDDPDNNF